MDELRLAFRRLAARPAATVASIITLACAIGAAAVTWSVLYAVLIRPLPLKDPERLVVVSTIATSGPRVGTLNPGVNYPYFGRVKESGVFADVTAAWSPMGLLTRVHDASPQMTAVAFVTANFFDTLGITIRHGRGFVAEDDRRGSPPVAILSERYWRRIWSSAPDALGQTVTINNVVVTIVGVAAPGFRGINLAEAPDMYLPFHVISDVGSPFTKYLADRTHQSSPTSGVTIVARLNPGTDAAEASARLNAVPAPFDERLRAPLGASGINTETLPPAARAGVKQFSGLLAATVGLLLLAGCTTVGLFLLIRTEARRHEFAMCLALGATRARLARGIVAEGTLLATCGALLSLPVAIWLFGLLSAFQLPGGVALEMLELSIDRRVLVAVAACAIAVVLAVSFVAGVFGFRASISDAVRARASNLPATGRRARSALVCAQVAIALFLLAGAGLFARSLAGALALNAGLDPARLIPVQISLAAYGYSAERAAPLFEEFRARIARNPAIRSVAASVSQGGMSGTMPIDGVPRKLPSAVGFRSIDQHYFATVGVAMVAGRDFTATDADGGPLVGIVSQSFARLLADGGNPIGRRITMPYSRPPAPPPQVKVVGVVPDVITSVTVMEPLMLYLPIAQQDHDVAGREFMVRAAVDANTARAEVLSAIKQLDRSVAPAPMYTMQERLGRQMSAQRFGATVLGALGAVAVLLTILGAYVLADSMATARLREMGIRAALGATRRQLGSMVLAQTGRLVGIGVAAGLGLSWLGASTIRAFLFQVQPLDPVTLIGTALLILVLTLAVSLRAAVRVGRADLAQVLRNE